MSKTPDEFLANVFAKLDSMRDMESLTGRRANIALASMMIERIARELDGKAEAVACLETVKFKIMIGDLPEQWWPKPDVQKGG